MGERELADFKDGCIAKRPSILNEMKYGVYKMGRKEGGNGTSLKKLGLFRGLISTVSGGAEMCWYCSALWINLNGVCCTHICMYSTHTCTH